MTDKAKLIADAGAAILKAHGGHPQPGEADFDNDAVAWAEALAGAALAVFEKPSDALYAVISVGCTECWDTSSPGVTLVTTDFAEASATAEELAPGREGDAFVLRLGDAAIVAYSGGDFEDDWIEDLNAEGARR